MKLTTMAFAATAALALVLPLQATAEKKSNADPKSTINQCVRACANLAAPFGVVCSQLAGTGWPDRPPTAAETKKCNEDATRRIEECKASCRSRGGGSDGRPS